MSDTKKVRIRSRFASYRWRDVKFTDHLATVDQATAAEMQKDRSFGQGKAFWIDPDAPAPAPAADSDPPKKTGGKKA